MRHLDRDYFGIVKASQRVYNMLSWVRFEFYAIVAIMVVLVVCGPTQYVVVVFVRRQRVRTHDGLPSNFVVHAFVREASHAGRHSFQVLFFCHLRGRFGALLGGEHGRVLISGTSMLRIREFQVTYFYARLYPFVLFQIAVNVFCRIRGVLRMYVRLFRKGASLLSTTREFSQGAD